MRKSALLVLVFLFAAAALAQDVAKQSTSVSDEDASSLKGKKTSSAAEQSASARGKAAGRPAVSEGKEQASRYSDGRASLEDSGFKFGYTPTNSTVFHALFVKNIGTDTLDIVQVRPG